MQQLLESSLSLRQKNTFKTEIKAILVLKLLVRLLIRFLQRSKHPSHKVVISGAFTATNTQSLAVLLSSFLLKEELMGLLRRLARLLRVAQL